MKTALFPGRFQPFHLGHLLTIQKILRNNHNIVIALRDAPMNRRNPFSLRERKRIIFQSLKEACTNFNRIEIVEIPDICDNWVKKIEKIADFSIVYSGNSDIKKPFRDSKYPVIHLSSRKKYYSGTKIRRLLSNDQSILDFTYPQTSKIIYRIFQSKNLLF